jgi:hypothetical protein
MTAKKSQSTSLVSWDEELAKQADIAAGAESRTGGLQFFGTRGGILTWQDTKVTGNQMAVVILDSVFETVYYDSKYDPDTPQSPVAFAFGRDEKLMTWHENSSPEYAGKLCSESDICEWGSADTGRGKAARETRRLAMISAGAIDQHGKFAMFDDVAHFETTAMGFLKLPVTSVKGFAGFVKQVAGSLRRPPFGIVTKVKVVPDSKTQFKVVFEPVMNIPDDFMGVIMKRHEEAKSIIDTPYAPAEEIPAQPSRGSRAIAKPTAKRGAPRKY